MSEYTIDKIQLNEPKECYICRRKVAEGIIIGYDPYGEGWNTLVIVCNKCIEEAE